MEQKKAAFSQFTETSKKTTGAEAAILRKEADLDLARLNLSYTVITAPYDGHVGRRTLEPGQYVQAGQTISYLVRDKDKWITANYKETQIPHIYIGQKVRIKVDALPGKIFNGEVTAISDATGSTEIYTLSLHDALPISTIQPETSSRYNNVSRYG